MMKTEKLILFILKVLCIVLCLGGGFAILGSFGAIERDHITMLQGFIQIIIATLSIALSLVLYVIRANLKDNCVRRENAKQKIRAGRMY